MKETLLSSHGVGTHIKFTSVKKRSPDGKDINTLVASNMKKVLQIKKIIKVKLSITLTCMPSMIVLNAKI